MNNAMTLFNKKNVSTVFGTDLPTTNNLSAGIAASYGFMRYKGKVWTLSYRGEDMPLMRADGDGPRNSIEVVVLDASPGISKTFYLEAFAEGANTPPDCASINGVVPNPASPKRQSKTCATCPQNIWGSRVTPAGKSAKACQDNKRLVIVPLQDITNEAYGGPLLLRVPPTSLQDLAQFGDKMHQQGYPSYTYGTRISFDSDSPHPKFKFEPVRPLNDEEAAQVLAIKDLSVIKRILNDTTEVGEAVTEEAPEWANPQQNQTTQSNPSTGETSTQSAPPADTTSPEPQVKASATPSPPASASPQPTPTAPASTSAQGTTKPAGFATTANTGKKNGSGFGADTPVPSQTTTKVDTTTQGAPLQPTSTQGVSDDKPQINTNPENRVAPEEVAAKFEQGLDDMVAKLLPK